VLPIGITILFLSMMIAGNFIKHFEVGRFIIKYILPIFCVVIPGILLVVDLIRKRMNQSRTNIAAEQLDQKDFYMPFLYTFFF
jgi:spore germination protein KB